VTLSIPIAATRPATKTRRASSRCAIAAAWALALLLAGCAAPPLASTPIEWSEADRWSVHVVTQDADGDSRVTRVWIVVLDGAGIIRTQQSRWRKNIERGSPVRLRIEGRDYPVRVEDLTDPGVRMRIDEKFAEKYGWQEKMVISEDRAATEDHYMRLTAAGP
jgi:hypothetical protein